jgi:hypothetical protein
VLHIAGRFDRFLFLLFPLMLLQGCPHASYYFYL